MKTLLVADQLGGQPMVTAGIENYMGFQYVTGPDLMEKFEEQTGRYPIDQEIGQQVTKLELDGRMKKVTIAGGKQFTGRSVIVASGKRSRQLGVPGEKELAGCGVSYCATCDGAFFRDRVVAVVGNNDEAFEEAHFLTKFVARVHLIMPSPTPKAQAALVNRIKTDPKITLRPATRLKEVLGNGVVEGVRIHPRSGRPETIPVSGAFIYLQGGRPITDYFLGQLQTRPEGCLDVDDEMQTSIRGVYAVGDLLCNHVKQAVIAAAGGATAAIAADKYVHGRSRLQTDWG
jgi:thioredoxin reductase (NADPH)